MHPKKLEMDEAQDYPECFPAGTLILTRAGYMPIEEVKVGDCVLTHRRRWRRVTSTTTRVRDTVTVAGHGHPGLTVSEGHKFWAVREDADANVLSNVLSSGPGWVRADSLESHWWAAPVRFPKVPSPPSPTKIGGRRGGRSWSEHSVDTLWILGLYLADGSIGFRPDGTPKSVTFTVHADEVGEVARRCKSAGLHATEPRQVGHSAECLGVTVYDAVFAGWVHENCGHGAFEKQVPAWVYGLRTAWRRAVFEGALFGDGCEVNDPRYLDGRWKFSTVGKKQAAAMRTLAATLGYVVSWYWVGDERERSVNGRDFCMANGGWYQLVGGESGQAFDHDLLRYQRVRDVRRSSRGQVLYDLGVDEDESFIAEGIVVHNSGWVELGETLKFGAEDSTWRAHGVSRGVRDRFYKQTQPNSGWRVHRVTAMHRDDWDSVQREAKAELYGSRDHPDYRRNILGMHGDAQSALFVLSRLMQCVDERKESHYNTEEYLHVRISEESLKDSGLPITALLNFPGMHQSYSRVWVGIDLGLTNHPTEILIFGEESKSGGPGVTGGITTAKKRNVAHERLKLLTRIHLERVGSPDQRRVIDAVWDFYRPRAIAMDSTGLGLPIYQEILNERSPDFNPVLAKHLRGYNFSGKITVGYEPVEDGDDGDPKPIEGKVLEYSSDILRVLVDKGILQLPWDRDLIREFQGQTYTISKSSTDAYGRKIFNKGKFHALDACRMAALARQQEFVEGLQEVVQSEPVFDSFLM